MSFHMMNVTNSRGTTGKPLMRVAGGLKSTWPILPALMVAALALPVQADPNKGEGFNDDGTGDSSFTGSDPGQAGGGGNSNTNGENNASGLEGNQGSNGKQVGNAGPRDTGAADDDDDDDDIGDGPAVAGSDIFNNQDEKLRCPKEERYPLNREEEFTCPPDEIR